MGGLGDIVWQSLGYIQKLAGRAGRSLTQDVALVVNKQNVSIIVLRKGLNVGPELGGSDLVFHQAFYLIGDRPGQIIQADLNNLVAVLLQHQ